MLRRGRGDASSCDQLRAGPAVGAKYDGARVVFLDRMIRRQIESFGDRLGVQTARASQARALARDLQASRSMVWFKPPARIAGRLARGSEAESAC